MLTPEEERQLRAAILRTDMGASRSGGVDMMAGSRAGSMTPEQMLAASQSMKGRQADLQSQMKRANALRGKQLGEGKTVGAGRYQTYMGNNWGDVANVVGQNLLGGYEAGQVREGLDDLDRAQSAADAAKLAIERDDVAFDQNIKTDTLGVAQGNLDATINQNAAGNALTRAAQAETARNNRAVDARGWAGESGQEFLDLTDPLGEATVIGYGSETGPVMRGPDGAMIPLDEARYQLRDDPNQVGTTGRGLTAAQLEAAALAKQDPAKGQGVASVTNVMNYLDAPFLEEAVGTSVNTFAGQYGVGNYGKGDQVQATQRKIQENVVNNLVPALKAAKLTPVSDKDLAKIESQYANAGTQPYGQVEFAANNFRSLFDTKFDEAIANGVQTPEAKAEYMTTLDKQIAKSAVLYGYPAEELVKAGVDPKIIRWAELNKEAFKADLERRRNL